MKKYNISKPEKYIKDGVEKTFWANIGTMTEFEKQDGSISRIIEIPAISLKANVFPQEPKETRIKTEEGEATAQEVAHMERVANSEPNPDDIPF